MGKLKISRLFVYGIVVILIVIKFLFPENEFINIDVIVTVFLASTIVSLIIVFIQFEKKLGHGAGKLSRYLLYISSIITITALILAVNKIAYKPVINIGLVGFVVSMVLVFVNSEKTAQQKQYNNVVKLCRYLLYISCFIALGGLVFRVNKIEYGKSVMSIGMIGVVVSTVFLFVIAKITKRKSTSGGTA